MPDPLPNPLLDRDVVDLPAEQYLRSVGTVFAEFGALTQDSGNVSYGVQIGADRYFVKTAGRPENRVPPSITRPASRCSAMRFACPRAVIMSPCQSSTVSSSRRPVPS
jgi:hypothetical protein